MKPATTPLIVRFSGLPATALNGLATDLCGEPLAIWLRVKDELRVERGLLMEDLYSGVKGASPPRRRLLLGIKRDCFNGRSLARYLDTQRSAGLLEEHEISRITRVAALEERMSIAWRTLEEAYSRQRARERHCLSELSENPAFVRGVALGSVTLAANLERLQAQSPTEAGHRERVLERGLLRYASRAALKLSPFSSLTRVALGEARADVEEGVRLLGGDWAERSLARMKRSVLEQYGQGLVLYPPLRRTLRVIKNDSLEEVAPDRYRFVRPGRWEREEEAGKLVYVKPALVQVSLRGALITRILQLVSERSLPYQSLHEDLEAEFEIQGDSFVRETLDRLLDLGVVLLELPWKSDDLHAEAAMLQFLQGFPDDEHLQRIACELEALVELEVGYARVGSPSEAVEAVERSGDIAGRIWSLTATLGGLPEEVRYEPPERSPIHEDVLLVPGPGASNRVAAELSRSKLEQVLSSIRPLVRLATMMDPNFDFLNSLSGLASQRWPDQSEVPFLDLFAAAQPLWREYTQFENQRRKSKEPRSKSFNPLQLDELEALQGLREEILNGLPGCVEIRMGEKHFIPEKLEALLDRVPSPYSSDRDVCLFLQPADPLCRRWALNGMFEAGRYHCRYTSIMDERMRDEVSAHYYGRALFRSSCEDLEIVDVLCSDGRTVNIHAPQTPRLIILPGEFSSLPEDRLLRLRDLRVQFRGAASLPVLIDRSGRRLLPTYLGTTVLRYMPLPLKFLALFGPGQISAVIPEVRSEGGPEVHIAPRLLIGNVVLRRKRWLMERETLLRAFAGNSEMEAFVSFSLWRRAHGIPDRFFLARREGDDFTKGKYKPQFVDATSPLFCSLLRSLLDIGPEWIGLDELLPSPEQAPRDGNGTPWSFEVQLDSVALGERWKVPETEGDSPDLHEITAGFIPA